MSLFFRPGASMRSLFTIHGVSTTERVVRAVALVAVIGIVGWAFWYNNAQVVNRLNRKQSYWDETKTLTTEQRQFVREVQRALAERFDLKLVVHVRSDALDAARSGKGVLFLGLVPSRREVEVRLPPDWTGAEDRALADELGARHFEGRWEQWPEALRTDLVMLWDHVNRAGQEAGEGARASQYVLDETGRLTAADLAWLDAYGRELERQLGQRLMVRAYRGPVQVPGLGATTLFVGLSPERGEVFVRLPLALRAALGPEGEARLRDETLRPALSGDWPGALKRGLDEIFTKATGAAAPTSTPASTPAAPTAPNRP